MLWQSTTMQLAVELGEATVAVVGGEGVVSTALEEKDGAKRRQEKRKSRARLTMQQRAWRTNQNRAVGEQRKGPLEGAVPLSRGAEEGERKLLAQLLGCSSDSFRTVFAPYLQAISLVMELFKGGRGSEGKPPTSFSLNSPNRGHPSLLRPHPPPTTSSLFMLPPRSLSRINYLTFGIQSPIQTRTRTKTQFWQLMDGVISWGAL